MVGWLVPGEGLWRTAAEERDLMGVRVLAARVPRQGKTPGSWRKAARRLRREGCRPGVAPPAPPPWGPLPGGGGAPVPGGGQSAALAAPLILHLLEARGCPAERASVVLRGQRVDQALFHAAMELCPRVRRLAVWAGEEGEELARDLHRLWGLPVVTPGAGWKADVTAEFAKPTQPADLILWGERPVLSGLTLGRKGGLPPDVDGLSLLALLWETHRVKTEDIEIFPSSKVQMT